MTNWPAAGGTVRDVPTERGLRDIRKRGGEAERLLLETIKKGLPPTGKVGGVLKGELPNPEFAKEPAYKAELENETTARKEVDGILKGEGEAEKASREAAVKAEKEARETADASEKTARETADNERIKGPASAVESDIVLFSGTTGKVAKDSGKTIAQLLLEAEETAKALSSAAAAGLSIKNPVAYATTAAIGFTGGTALTLKGTAPLTIDGTTITALGTRVLIKDQIGKANNGIFELTAMEAFAGEGKFGGGGKFAEGSSYTLTRTKDADETSEVKQGMFVLVTNGTANKATSWLLTSPDPITIGTTAQEFSAFTAAPTGLAGGGLTGTYPNPSIKEKVIVNADVSDTAAIEYKKLNLTGKIIGADIAEKTIEETDMMSPNNVVYRLLHQVSSTFGAATAAATYLLTFGNATNATNGAAITASPYLDPADYAVEGKTTRYRLRAQVLINAVAPAVNLTFGLYPVSTVKGAAGGITFNVGTVIAGSTVAINAPAKESLNQGNSGDFTAPAANFYVIGCVVSGSTAASSWINASCQLQMHNT
jgi:hypothetical protein